MNILRTITIVVALFLIASCATTSPNTPDNSLKQDFQTLPLNKAFNHSSSETSEDSNLPLSFKVPKIFKKREFSELQTTLWGTKEDIDLIARTKNLRNSKYGIFSFKVSLNVGYDESLNKFTNEDKMANTKNLPGISDVKFSRTNNNGFPIATLTAKAGSKHIYILYVAIGSAALKVDYFPSKNFSERDEENWAQFTGSLRNN